MEKIDLLEEWMNWWNNVGAIGDPVKSYNEIVNLYSIPKRAYHNWEGHIARGYIDLKEVINLGLAEHPNRLKYSWDLHDCKYYPERHNNEEQSAAYAYRFALDRGLSVEFAGESKKLIVITKHIEVPKTIDEKIMVDIDLAVLGYPFPEFNQYRKDIREEYSFVSPPLYKEGRIALLQRFLGKKPLYQTDYFRNKYEAKARDNLKRAIEDLKKEKT